jgi:hypothetical protein
MKFYKSLPSLSILVALILTTFLSACKKNDSGSFESPPDLQSRINASAEGYVTDELNAPVSGATVKMGSITVVTNTYGYFKIENASVVQKAAVVTVSQSGYFNAVKSYEAQTDKVQLLRIKLIPKNTIGIIDAAVGGSVSDANGMQITLPANGVVLASNNAPYTGPVEVSAHWLNPENPDIVNVMPGDLRALNEDGLMRTLITYGMIKVELYSGSGEKLQLAPDKKANLTFPLPSSLSASAPATIPLWYFDEEKGLWVEEGNATLNGNSYVGEVSHFSYWNCDVPTNFVRFNVTILDANGNPVIGAPVTIRLQSNPYTSGSGYTDSTGYTSGYIPANSALVLEVHGMYYCSTPVYSQPFNTANSNLSLGVITLPAPLTATISGQLTDCTLQPVQNGNVMIIQDNGWVHHFPTDNQGNFTITYPTCNFPTNISYVGIDPNTNQQSPVQTMSIVAGNNVITSLQACGVQTNQFIHLTVDANNVSLLAPPDSVYSLVYGSQSITVGAYSLSNADRISFQMSLVNIGLNSQQQIYTLASNIYPDSSFQNTQNLLATITEFGNTGEFISGEFSGIVVGPPPGNVNYNVSCTFRFRRTF